MGGSLLDVAVKEDQEARDEKNLKFGDTKDHFDKRNVGIKMQTGTSVMKRITEFVKRFITFVDQT